MKTVKSFRDLAINGASPAFADPLHVGRPNIGERKALHDRLDEILDAAWLSNNGPQLQELENRLADRLGVGYCIAMCNGTVALEIAVRALEFSGEVIVPSYTFIATAHALHWQQIKPVFADIDPLTHNLEPASVNQLITPETTGIIGVHLWGRPAPIEELQEIADTHDLRLAFDAAHAFGCSYRGTPIGNFGECEVFSFHATKFFNTFEGGAVATNNPELAEKMRLMRNFGFAGYDNVVHPGTNGKMTEIQAAMGLVNLDSFDDFISTNKRHFHQYHSRLDEMSAFSLINYDDAEANNYQYLIVEMTEEAGVDRDTVVDTLNAENVLARKYFWPGCHRMMPYRELQPNAGRDLPNTTRVAERVFSLPTGTGVDDKQIDLICDILAVACESRAETRESACNRSD
ncbi:MAG: DegT/DnrJ/EryC1/StrS family aminotransferase [Gammaproteobacteria bacterium]|nr:DegT/DnrJ/EryC1/StrS family aminotransferase [Gammaproteobacteria bacterium]